MGFVLTTQGKFKKATITRHFGFVFQENSGSGKSRDYRDVIVSEKLRFQNVSPQTETRSRAFSNSSGLKSVFEKLCFLDGLVWTVGLTVELKLRFQRFLQRRVSRRVHYLLAAVECLLDDG